MKQFGWNTLENPSELVNMLKKWIFIFVVAALFAALAAPGMAFETREELREAYAALSGFDGDTPYAQLPQVVRAAFGRFARSGLPCRMRSTISTSCAPWRGLSRSSSAASTRALPARRGAARGGGLRRPQRAAARGHGRRLLRVRPPGDRVVEPRALQLDAADDSARRRGVLRARRRRCEPRNARPPALAAQTRRCRPPASASRTPNRA